MSTPVYEAAKEILQNNIYEIMLDNKTHRRTLPSKEFYMHQWNWDSATHAMGLIHIDETWAYEEILCLLSGQWKNGLIPHIVFNPAENSYFPGPDFWKTEKASGITQLTSGITQPPLLAISIEYLYREIKDRKQADVFLQTVLPKLISYHKHLKTYRDSEDNGLLTIIHPWESGTDNSPRWDRVLETIQLQTIPKRVKESIRAQRSDNVKGVTAHRPIEKDYYRYIYLIDLYKSWHWDYKKIMSDTPFAVKDVLFNAIWCRANCALANLSEQAGDTKHGELFRSWENQTRNALHDLWDNEEKVFMTVDVTHGKKRYLKENTIANFLPLYAKAADEKQLFELLNQLVDPQSYWTPFPFPSTAVSHEKFELTRYWRGPTWPITNLFIIEGLLQYSDYPIAIFLAREALKKTINMIELNGFFEYYHPNFGKESSGRALGFGAFSWSAAIYIYLLHEYQSIKTNEPLPGA